MSAMSSKPVVPELATTEDLTPLALTFATAFVDDPMIRWPMPDATPQELQALFRAILMPYLELGVAWKVGGDLGGAAWLPPSAAEQFAEIELSTRAAISSLTPTAG